MISKQEMKARQSLYDWLSEADELPNKSLELVIGFGHFDLRIVHRSCELITKGLSNTLAFSGGIGAGTADLGRPEADAFLEQARTLLPSNICDKILVENKSTNTGENVQFLQMLLRETRPDLPASPGLRTLGLVATPVRMRRVRQTAAKFWPDARLFRLPPSSTLEEDERIFSTKQKALVCEILGEMERLRLYPNLGFIEPLPIPPEILEIEKWLRLRQAHRQRLSASN